MEILIFYIIVTEKISSYFYETPTPSKSNMLFSKERPEVIFVTMVFSGHVFIKASYERIIEGYYATTI